MINTWLSIALSSLINFVGILQAMEISVPVMHQTEKQELDKEFSFMLTFLCQQPGRQQLQSRIKTPYGTVYISKRGSLKIEKQSELTFFKIKRTRKKHLIKVLQAQQFQSQELVDSIAASIDNQFIVALSKNVNKHIMTGTTLAKVYLFDLQKTQLQAVEAKNMPPETVYTENNELKGKLLKEGYSYIGKTSFQEIFGNNYSCLAVCPGGKLVAIANGNSVYVAEQDDKGILQELKHIKTYPVLSKVSEVGLNDFANPCRISCLVFNKQGTELGIIRENNEGYDVEVLELVG